MTTIVESKNLEIFSGFMQAIGQKSRQYSDCYQGSCQLTRTEFTLICVLEQHGSMMMKDLNTYLNEVSLSTLTRLIDSLEAEDYVKRSTDPSDRRCFKISLTDKVITLLKGYPKQMEQLAVKMLTSLTLGEQQTLIQMIGKMKQHLKKNEGVIDDEA